MSAVAIMQPYFFPYLGYWQLINAVDQFVIFDDVTYIKKGYIDRNIIVINDLKHSLKVKISKASQNKLISELEIHECRDELVSKIYSAYRRTPYFSRFMPVVEKIFESREINLSRFLGASIEEMIKYLKLNSQILYSSHIESKESGAEKIIPIVESLGGDRYINMDGGSKLYDKHAFLAKNIDLKFLKYKEYSHRKDWGADGAYLSILDVCFHVSPESLRAEGAFEGSLI